MRILRHGSFILILAALGCAGPRLVYDVDPTFRSAQYRTVAPDPRSDRVIIREGMRPLNPELHLKAALAELATRSYQVVPAPQADLWVATYVLMGASPGGRGGSEGAAHKEGSGEGHRGGGHGGSGTKGNPPSGIEGRSSGSFKVIIQFQDRKTGQTVWHGEATLDHKDKSTDGGPLTIEEAVHQLLEPLPARH
jgi:hypothetical protein